MRKKTIYQLWKMSFSSLLAAFISRNYDDDNTEQTGLPKLLDVIIQMRFYVEINGTK